eukprot:scaffold2262_cov312-Prasinococcus_capsulatus_cf.AAC.11
MPGPPAAHAPPDIETCSRAAGSTPASPSTASRWTSSRPTTSACRPMRCAACPRCPCRGGVGWLGPGANRPAAAAAAAAAVGRLEAEPRLAAGASGAAGARPPGPDHPEHPLAGGGARGRVRSLALRAAKQMCGRGRGACQAHMYAAVGAGCCRVLERHRAELACAPEAVRRRAQELGVASETQTTSTLSEATATEGRAPDAPAGAAAAASSSSNISSGNTSSSSGGAAILPAELRYLRPTLDLVIATLDRDSPCAPS